MSNRTCTAARRCRFAWIVAAAVAAAFLIPACGRKSEGDPSPPDPPERKSGERAAAAPVAKKVPTGRCRVYTQQPGFFVFVDGDPARDGKDEWLQTPCEITVPQGAREITVARNGFQDASRLVNIKDETQVLFEDVPATDEPGKSLLDSAYIRSPVAEPVSLLSLNDGVKKFDPYISADGRSLYFAAERNFVKGVYHVNRMSAFHYFDGLPQLVNNARGSDLPASPTLTTDALAVVYTVPQTGDIICVSRQTAVGEFGPRKTLQARHNTTAQWTAAQVIRDGNSAWRLYWLERDRGKLQGFVTVGKQTREGEGFGDSGKQVLAPVAEQEFGKPEPFDLRGNPPCMSQDGLRQYVFDGRTLKRSTRQSASRPFGPLETIASFTLPSYQPAPNRRSYSITDDEQWLFYESGGDLHMIRVFNGRGWGFVCRGRSIPPLPAKVASLPKKQPDEKSDPKQPAVDPRTVPLAYPPFRKKLLALLKARKYADARRHVKAAFADSTFAKDRNLLAWDREDVERTAAFWDDFHKALARLKPGDPIEIGPAKLKFVKYEKGELFVASATRQAAKKPLSMPAVELINIVDNRLGRTDADVQRRVGHFRWFDDPSDSRVALQRLNAAGKRDEFTERLAARDVQQARHEFDRQNIGRALQLAQAVLKDHPNSKAAAQAQGIIDKSYSLVKWDSVGGRTWQIKDGAYTAAPGASAGSLLRSPAQFESFELRLEWRSDAPNGQGGVYFRYAGSGNLIDNALKLQLADDVNSVVDPLCTGAIFKVAAPTENAVRRRGEWNTLLLRVRDEKVHVEINGRKVLDTTVKNDKLPLKGYVALDGGLGGITYRRTLLVELP